MHIINLYIKFAKTIIMDKLKRLEERLNEAYDRIERLEYELNNLR